MRAGKPSFQSLTKLKPRKGVCEAHGHTAHLYRAGMRCSDHMLPAWAPGTLGHIPFLLPRPWFPVLTVPVRGPSPPQRCMAWAGGRGSHLVQGVPQLL